MMKNLFTSEQVSCGHPDKICDQISDAILTECLKQDKDSRVAVETMIKNHDVIVAGEVTTKAVLDIDKIVHDVLVWIGYSDLEAYEYRVTNLLDEQSPDIAQGVDTGGAGDQGIMFGYACNETTDYMPLAWSIATVALERLRDLKHPLLKPDAKAQVTIDYDSNRIDTFLISTQHDEEMSNEEIRSVVKNIMIDTARQFNMNEDFKILINPTGRFVIGGSMGDCGLTGRKIIADTYGGYARHGGGAFSGKDPTKVDRSAAYMARYLAKLIVKNVLDVDWCEIQLAYAIGVSEPVSVKVSTNLCEDINTDLGQIVKNSFDLSPQGIIDFLCLKEIDYTKTSCYGHFGKDYLPWEQLD